MDGTLSLSDLKDALKETLEARGSMGQIKARIRAEIFQALDEGAPKAKLSNENLIINELIREYLEYNGYRHALSVFLPESGQPVEKPFQRRFLAQELNIVDDPRFNQVPLLYSIVTALQDSKHTRMSMSCTTLPHAVKAAVDSAMHGTERVGIPPPLSSVGMGLDPAHAPGVPSLAASSPKPSSPREAAVTATPLAAPSTTATRDTLGAVVISN
ncbi:Aste57867_20629 [Aphanomyces stellatus]|uniref:Centrosomal protein 20 n=1 Tax=Aphanomyces stellatus TaxID=120398 RepID=A0A485LFD7_9STRA|nr:hypothetical protein As57867_020561 [Aphanomyces stellatus]VFT97309.1 Aste57867_20629 [Aphanomyces stellatus]